MPFSELSSPLPGGAVLATFLYGLEILVTSWI